MKNKEKIIVTGGAGFIGSHVVDLLAGEGYKVIVFDNLSTGKLEYINKKADFERVDITKHNKVFELVDKIKPGAILHLAAWPRVVRSIDDPINTNRVNVDGTLVMLEAAKRIGTRSFVYSSSSSVYGDQTDFRMKEEFKPNPKSLYALQKTTSEYYCTFYAKKYGIIVFSLRYFNVYGERQPDTGIYSLVMGKFLKQQKENKNLTIYGNGRQTRDFTYVSDVANANLLALKAKTITPRNIILNVGSGEETSINKIAEYIGGGIKHIFPNPRGNYEEKRKVAVVIKAEKVLKWKPTVFIKEGIEKIRK